MDNEPDDAPTPRVRRRDAAKHLFHPKTLKGGLEINPQPHVHVSALAGVQAGLTAALALPLIHISSFADLIGFAALGTLVALFGRFAPPRQRNRILFHCLMTQTMTVFVMSSLAWLGLAEPLLLAVLSLACASSISLPSLENSARPACCCLSLPEARPCRHRPVLTRCWRGRQRC